MKVQGSDKLAAREKITAWQEKLPMSWPWGLQMHRNPKVCC